MALRLTKNSKIVFAVVIVVLSAALGFLIWRVNQEDNLNPDDSQAGATVPGGCSAGATIAYSADCLDWWAEPGQESACQTNRSGCCGNTVQNGCQRCLCCDGTWVVGSTSQSCDTYLCVNHGGSDNCEEEPVDKCYCESWGDGCGTNCTFPSGTQADVDARAQSTCKPQIAMCNVSTGEVTIEEYGPSHACYNKVSQCKNPYSDNPCTPTNSCDRGAWVTRPTGSVAFDADISFSATATDSDGIDNATITAKLCTGSVAECTTGEAAAYTVTATNATSTTFGGTLSSSSDRLVPGTYTLSLAWKDKLGASSSDCKLTTVFTVQPEETNPDWDISKRVVELCIDEGTENPKAQLTYTITVSNTGDAAGTISKIEDVLDTKILANGITPTDITAPGSYASGKITWNFATPLNVAAGANAVYTYKVVVEKDDFGTYGNTVTLTPVGSDAIQATAEIIADCQVTIPQTGIFDTTLGRIVSGFVLLIFGVLVYNLPNRVFVIKRDGQEYKYRVKFERKVANR